VTDNDAIHDTQTNSSFSSDDEVEDDATSGESVDSDLTAYYKGRPPTKPIPHGPPRSADKIVKKDRRMRWLDSKKDVKWDSNEATGVKLDRFQAEQLSQ
jgi:hypothetical protein